jgi:Tol biopolymer transport system component
MTPSSSRIPRAGRRLLALGAVLALAGLAVAALPAPAALATTTGTTPPLSTVTVNNGPGDQSDPHLSGSLVTYTSALSGDSEIRYHDLADATDAAIPTNGGLDFLPDVSGTTVVYTHLTSAGSAIFAYDTATAGPPTELDPQPSSNRRGSAVGGHTVAWVDYGFYASTNYPEIVAYDLASRSATRLTSDLLFDTSPAVAADGSVIAWTKCQSAGTSCDIWQATAGAAGWTTTRLTGPEGEEQDADSNGQVVVYDSVRDGEADIFWQPVGGGPEHRLALPGIQHNPNISGHVVAFESLETADAIPNWDVVLYDLASDTVYRLTPSTVDEILNDVSLAADGLVRVAYTAQEGGSDSNVYAVSFDVTAVDTTPPVLHLPADLTTQATGNSQATVTYTATATDLVDGPVPVSCSPTSGSAFAAGTTMVTCSATDAHGNTATGSFTVSVVYGWAGFFQPVDNLPTVNTVKAGSAIPVKFSLSGNQGLNIFKSGSPASASYTCSGTAPTDAIEQTVTASTSSLSYDATTDQYAYVWKTDKAWAGSCRALVVKLADNTIRTANFQFTK